MRRIRVLTLLLMMLFVFSLVDLSGVDPVTNSFAIENEPTGQNYPADSINHSGVGTALSVSFSGTFTNASSWSASSNTLNELFTPGVSYSVENASVVTWTAYVLVSPPPEVESLSFTVTYPITDWLAVSVIDPLGIARINPTEWFTDYDSLIVSSNAIDVHGLWKLTFYSANHLTDLQMGPSGGPYSSTTTFDTGDTMRFGVESSWISGATAEFELIDPSGSVWQTSTDTTSGLTSHMLPSFRYRKDITIHNEFVTGDFTDFPVLIDILDTDLHTDVQADGDDIVFYSNGVILAHQIELFEQNYNPTQAHLVAWVKANLSNTADTIISMYYGNPVIGSQERPDDVWTSDYSAVWHLGEDATDEGTSADHYDSTGNGYYGDQSGNNGITGIFGTGQNFDGTDDTINVAAARGLEPSGQVTLSGWFKLDSGINQNAGVTQVLLTKAIDGDTDMHIAIAGSDYSHASVPQGSLVFKMENAGLGQKYVWSLRRSWSAGSWYFFTCTMYATTPSLNKVFINGFDNTNTTSGSLSTASLTFTDDWVIGGGFMDQMTPPEGWFDGVIDEVRVVNTIRSNAWIQTEWLMYQSSSSFRTIASESAETSPNMYIEETLDLSAISGTWTVVAHYNDSGSSVSHRVGEYQRNFIVRRASTLSIDSPSGAASGLESLTVGDILYLVVDLSDINTASPIIGASVSMNWTISGLETSLDFEDLGDGCYSLARNTSELSSRQRWRLEIDSTHPYYLDASTSFDLDLYHPTELTYEWVSTTPVGYDFTATLVYRDTWDGSLISGATITFDDGAPVTVLWSGSGRYNISVTTGALSRGLHAYTFNATNTVNLYEMASVNVTFILRAHYTAVSISGNLITPWGDDTSVNVVLVDLDTGLVLDSSVVSSITFTSSYGSQIESSLSSLVGITLDTNTWSVGITSVDIALVMSDSDYYAPTVYSFDVDLRNHLTSVNVLGNLTTPYGADTTITVAITDLDGGIVDISDVTSFTFTSIYGSQVNSSLSSYTLDLKTNAWSVASVQVTLSVVMSGDYDNPKNYVFFVTIRSLQTVLYNAPNDLIFPQEYDFFVIVHFNVSESGQYYGLSINGEAGQFTVSTGATVYVTTITPLGNGMYNISIDWSYFIGAETVFILIEIDPSSNLYAPASLVVIFEYRPATSDLTANLYTVSTPYNMDVTVHLYYRDLDRDAGITTGTITTSDASITWAHISNGDYQVDIDVSGFGIGSHTVNLTATASSYDTRWLIITVVVTQIHTDAEPTVIRLEIPSGNTKIFYIEWTDLDNDVSLQATSTISNWTGSIAPVFTWTGTRYQITFATDSSDVLGTYLVTFNFSINSNYQDGYCEIQVEIRSHDTILTSDSPPPTAFNAIINITLYYYDFDNKVGIHDPVLVQEDIYEDTAPVISNLIAVGSGYYIVQIDASTVGLGLHNFTIYIIWTGAVQQYENNVVSVSVSVIGVDSQMTLLAASDPSPYLSTMTYTFLYSEKDSGIGIANSTDQGYGTGNVHIYVSFNAPFDSAKLTITEVDALIYPGRYSIEIDTTGFGDIGQFTMTITIQWTPFTDPYYSDREDTVSVWVLARDTLLLINPPSPVSYGEEATFSFRWEDTALGSNILLDTEMDISMNVTFSLGHVAGLFTITIDTNQFPDMGTYKMILNVLWAGEPFYSNRTNRLVTITLLARQTVLDYPTPDPTFYSDNVTITVTWTDVTGGGSTGILGATITVSDNSGLIPSNEYDVRGYAGGVYEIEFSTSRFATTGLWEITVELSVSETYIADKSAMRILDVRQRRTILSYEAIGKVAYGNPIEFILYFDDLYTSTSIGNDTNDVTLEILTAGTWIFDSTWNGALEHYEISITSYPDFGIGVPFNIQFRMSYSNIAPFYAYDDLTATFELRSRLSLLSLETAPSPTPYLDIASFQIQFVDADSESGITADYIWIYYEMTNLTYGIDYFYSNLGSGLYQIDVNSTALGGLGQWTITTFAYWIQGAPYHNNASTPINVRVTTRDTIVDVTVPPSQTPFLDNATFTFEYSDLSRGTAITSISISDIFIYKNKTLLSPGDFSLIPSGNGFIISIDSEVLGPTLGRYNITILIDWDELTSPYYVDAQSTTWVNIVRRTLSFTLDPLDETPYGHLLNISFTLTDMATGALVDGAIVSFSAQAISLTLGDDYNITPMGSGIYLIEIDTTPFDSPGNFLFDLDISWNPLTSPYYRTMKTIVLTGVISDIETQLTALYEEITTDWLLPASITVYYRDIIWLNSITGATVGWEIPDHGTGSLSEIGTSGNYTIDIDTSSLDAGIYIISITASKNNYDTARIYITLILLELQSDIIPITPVDPVHIINRGEALPINISLVDGLDNPIFNDYFLDGTVRVESGGTYTLVYTGIPGQYYVLLPENDEMATKRTPGSYTITIVASLLNYEPAAYSFKIQVLQSATAVTLTGSTIFDMSRTYSENVTVYVQIVLPNEGNAPFWNTTVTWSVADTSISGNFTHIGNGNFSAIIRTIDVGFGIWNIIFKAIPFENASLYAGSQTTISFAIKRIQTSAILPETRDFYWGWSGNLRFSYWDETFGKGIPGADVTIELPGLDNIVFDVGNGTYLVFFNTSLLRASSAYIPLVVSLSKLNYVPQTTSVNIRVLEVPTDVFVSNIDYSPAYSGTIDDFEDQDVVYLQVPFGDTMTIYFFYNDTEISDGFIGGLIGAHSTFNSYLRGPSIDSYLNVTVIEIGLGLYSIIFDTADAEINAIVSSEAYRLYVEMNLENRTIADILFRITVIDIPTELSIVNEPSVWRFVNGESLTIELRYWDTWHDTGIVSAYFSANASRGAPFTVSTSEGPAPGQYLVEVSAEGIKFSPGSGTVTIQLGSGVFTIGEDTIVIELEQNSIDVLVTNSIQFGLPIVLVIMILGFAYVRVWSVPKRLRQINSQIKTIRKGKIPKPVAEAKSRQTLIAELFNDTFEKVEIVRTADEMPEESVPVEVPELGDLLIQLSILTHLDQKELDDFKADISKMKMSEQAAFVKEVIVQEAIRAARRDHKTVEQVIEEVQKQAASRVVGETEAARLLEEEEEEEPEVERVILPSEKKPVETKKPVSFEEPEPRAGEDISFSSDRLGPFEIEELKKDLEAKGVPLHEIDTILQQAKELPRDLVEELIRSLDRERETRY